MIEIKKISKTTQGYTPINQQTQNKINNPVKANNEDEQKNFLKLQAILEQKPKNDKNSKSNTNNKSSSQGIPELKIKDHNGSKQNNNVIIKKNDEQKKQIKELVVKQKDDDKRHSQQEISKYEKIKKQIKPNHSTSIQQITKQKEEKDSSYQPLKIHKPILNKEKVIQKDEDEIKENLNDIIIQKKNPQNNIEKQEIIRKDYKQEAITKDQLQEIIKKDQKQEVIKKDQTDQAKKIQPQVKGQNNIQQVNRLDIGNQKLMELLNQSSHNTKKNKNKEKQKQEEQRLKEQKNQSKQKSSTSVNKDKIKELQNQKSKPFSIKPQIKDLSIQKQNRQKNQVNDDYDLNDSFINDSESVDMEIDPKEVVSELKKLQQRKKERRRLNDEEDEIEDDIEEADFDTMLKEEKKSRVLGIIDDYREEKYIKKEIKREKKEKKKMMEKKNKQENKIKEGQ
ncbi:unnamed protein product [Paramecium sonneborni]|uniref:Uncharacterized protein n=1 Tax=Paramecium sonneborni TaxID=65129 RepID=A0A8S1N1D4_9CILI|nr:unnamed protein product [Paramecium sonneborni]